MSFRIRPSRMKISLGPDATPRSASITDTPVMIVVAVPAASGWLGEYDTQLASSQKYKHESFRFIFVSFGQIYQRTTTCKPTATFLNSVVSLHIVATEKIRGRVTGPEHPSRRTGTRAQFGRNQSARLPKSVR